MGWLVDDCNCGGWFVVIGGGWLCNAGYVVVSLCFAFSNVYVTLNTSKKTEPKKKQV